MSVYYVLSSYKAAGFSCTSIEDRITMVDIALGKKRSALSDIYSITSATYM